MHKTGKANSEPAWDNREKDAPLDVRGVAGVGHRLIQRGGKFANPQGNLTLTIRVNESVKGQLLEYLEAFQHAP